MFLLKGDVKPTVTVTAYTVHNLVTLTLTLVSGQTWRVTYQPPHQIWKPYAYPFLSYEFWHLTQDSTDNATVMMREWCSYNFPFESFHTL